MEKAKREKRIEMERISQVSIDLYPEDINFGYNILNPVEMIITGMKDSENVIISFEGKRYLVMRKQLKGAL